METISVMDNLQGNTVSEVGASTVLQKLEGICAEIYSRWDADQRSGKLLAALAGSMPNYRADVDAIRAALNCHDDMLAALKMVVYRPEKWPDVAPGELVALAQRTKEAVHAAIAKATGTTDTHRESVNKQRADDNV